ARLEEAADTEVVAAAAGQLAREVPERDDRALRVEARPRPGREVEGDLARGKHAVERGQEERAAPYEPPGGERTVERGVAAHHHEEVVGAPGVRSGPGPAGAEEHDRGQTLPRDRGQGGSRGHRLRPRRRTRGTGPDRGVERIGGGDGSHGPGTRTRSPAGATSISSSLERARF